MTPQVSVILPVRNGARTLEDAIQTILAQSFSDFELLIANDHSTDESGKIADEYAREDSRVHHILVEGEGGLVSALNQAFQAAQAPLLARMDADDLCHPERLSEQVAFLEESREIAGCSCLIDVIGNGRDPAGKPDSGFTRYRNWLNELMEPAQINRERFIESPIVHPTILMRREVLVSSGGYRDMPWAEDYDLWLRIMEQGGRFAKVPRYLYTWRDRPNRLTRSDSRYSQRNFLRCKAHFLARIGEIQNRGVMISGAGPIGKTICRFLLDEDIQVHAFFDLGPKRIGKRLLGIPVHHAENVPQATGNGPIQLSAVGRAGRRHVVRNWMQQAGYSEGINFWCVA